MLSSGNPAYSGYLLSMVLEHLLILVPRSALEDHRFHPIGENELPKLECA